MSVNTVCTSDECGRPVGLRGHLDEFSDRLRASLSRWVASLIRRPGLDVATLDDRMLTDIGLRRHEFGTASNMPLEINASPALRHNAEERRAAAWRLRRY